jgi:hypothetical protein
MIDNIVYVEMVNDPDDIVIYVDGSPEAREANQIKAAIQWANDDRAGKHTGEQQIAWNIGYLTGCRHGEKSATKRILALLESKHEQCDCGETCAYFDAGFKEAIEIVKGLIK